MSRLDEDGEAQSKRHFKLNLADRLAVVLAKSDGYKTKNNTEKRKTCSVCTKGFVGRDDQATCSPACRMKKSRS